MAMPKCSERLILLEALGKILIVMTKREIYGYATDAVVWMFRINT